MRGVLETTEVPTRINPTTVITKAILSTLTDAASRAEAAGAPALRAIAEQVLRTRLEGWAEQAEAEITKAAEAAVAQAMKDWKKHQGALELRVAEAVAFSRTQDLMEEWAAAAAAQVMAEVDEQGLISTDVLTSIRFDRGPRKGEKKGAQTDGLEATDEEFAAWWLTQLGEHGINNFNRLRIRLLLVAALDWVRSTEGIWRNPRLAGQ